jgi:hypothetical protein
MRQGDVYHRHVQDDHELGAEHDAQGDAGPPLPPAAAPR